MRLDVPVLKGARVRLEPLSLRHAPDLAQAAEEDRSSYGFTLVPRAADVEDDIRTRLGRPGWTPFAQIRLADGRAVGCTTLLNPRARPDRDEPYAVEIGGTWLAASAQRTGLNTDAKLLLLTHSFETLGVARVDINTDARNQRSRRAIERLGAHFEGVLRNWAPSWAPGETGLLRDTAVFSVIAPEWPTIKAALTERVLG
ncbi:RimJ/RimL family protein N-acetyltransferase [Actinocorallia herbida]|uniref:RimJ/RimL family protein N-acetyltransferase n=1 Tax=Actinocorallia herbida TaxID=58109 RepID=A0A3N1D114_9ACTN|nr:GNAT family protein [Actinocorallia herbida]ROO86758.1 RimJ/RimL family protein N-acetyltransferase [Actinocorallia herbida]